MPDLSTLEWVLVAFLVTILTLGVTLFIAWRFIGARGRAMSRRVGELPMRQRVQLAGSLFGDPRLPAYTRLGLALIVLYLALPVDLIPDFVPLLGQLDDVVMLTLGGALLLKTVPSVVIEDHLSRIEAEVVSGRAL